MFVFGRLKPPLSSKWTSASVCKRSLSCTNPRLLSIRLSGCARVLLSRFFSLHMYLGLTLFPSVPLTRWFSLHSLRLDFSPHCFTLSQFASSFFPQWVSYKVTSRRPLSTQTKPGQSVPWYKDNKFALNLIFCLSIHPLFSLEHNSPCVCELFESLNVSFWWGLNFFHLLWPVHCYSKTDSSSSLAGLRQQCPRTDIQTFSERKVCSFAEMLSHSVYPPKKADMCDTNVDLSEHGTEKKNKNST